MSRRSGPISKLSKNDPLAKLHANFWPTTVKDGDEDTRDDNDMGINATKVTQDGNDKGDGGAVGLGVTSLIFASQRYIKQSLFTKNTSSFTIIAVNMCTLNARTSSLSQWLSLDNLELASLLTFRSHY